MRRLERLHPLLNRIQIGDDAPLFFEGWEGERLIHKLTDTKITKS